MAFSAGDDACAFAYRVVDQLIQVVAGGLLDQRPLLHARLDAVPYLERLDSPGERVDEAIMNAGLDEKAIRADTGLAAVPVLRRHRTFNRGVEIRVVEHDERCVAAEFERVA